MAYSGLLNLFGNGILQKTSFAASNLQKAVGTFTVSDMLNGIKILKEITALKPQLKYQALTTFEKDPSYLCFPDASHSSNCYRQTGYPSGIKMSAGGASVYHVSEWNSCKQSRVSFSSIGAEIIAAATSTDRRSLRAERLKIIFGFVVSLSFVLALDSHRL